MGSSTDKIAARTRRGPAAGSYREGSFVAKVAQIRLGESMTLDDTNPGDGPTRLERDLQTQMRRSPALVGRTYTTRRVQWIDGDRVRVALRISRTT